MSTFLWRIACCSCLAVSVMTGGCIWEDVCVNGAVRMGERCVIPDANGDAGPVDSGPDASGDAEPARDSGSLDAAACTAPLTECTDGCADLSSDLTNCGTCGTACGWSCRGGMCRDAIDLSVGYRHGCVALSDGRAGCWGDNRDRQLSDGTDVSRTRPTLALGVDGLIATTVAHVAASQNRTCFRHTDGRVICAGWMVDAAAPPGPDGTGTLRDVIEISAGRIHHCGILATREAVCWGWNYDGELGNDGMDLYDVPPVYVLAVGGGGRLTGVDDILAGNAVSCARLGDRVACWGARTGLGDADCSSSRGTPDWVVETAIGSSVPLGSVTAIGGGGPHTCAIAAGRVACWGPNHTGQLGDGTVGNACRPTEVRGIGGTGLLTSAASVGTGNDFSCALLDDTRVACWGGNDAGQLGTGDMVSSTSPVLVMNPEGDTPLSGVRAISLGSQHACASMLDGTVLCWGTNMEGQLGNGTFGDPVPLPVPVLPPETTE